MTLYDLSQSVKRYWYIMLALPLVFLLCTLLYSIADQDGQDSDFESGATITANSGLELITGIAIRASDEYESQHSGIDIAVTPNTKTSSLRIVVKGQDADLTEEAATELSERVITTASDYYLQRNDEWGGQWEFVANYDVDPPVSSGIVADTGGLSKLLLIALLAGVLLALGVIAVIVSVKKPVISAYPVVGNEGVPWIEFSGTCSEAEMIVAVTRLSVSRGSSSRLCVLPISSRSCSDIVVESVNEALNAERFEGVDERDGLKAPIDHLAGAVRVVEASPLDSSIEGIYLAHDSDVSMIVVAKWKDSIGGIEKAIEKMELSKTNVACFVLVNDAALVAGCNNGQSSN